MIAIAVTAYTGTVVITQVVAEFTVLTVGAVIVVATVEVMVVEAMVVAMEEVIVVTEKKIKNETNGSCLTYDL